MYILGFTCYGDHDSAACILKDGEIIAASEEERFTRIKHDPSFPINSIKFCLKEAGISINDVDHVCYGWQKGLWKIGYKIAHILKYFPRSLGLFRYKKDVSERLIAEKVFREKFDYKGKFNFVEHHVAHATNHFFLSGFKSAAVVSADGMGEWTSSWLGKIDNAKIDVIKEIPWPHSLGNFYCALTEYLGFKIFSDEYKVMGLSAYGSDSYRNQFEKVLQLDKNGGYKLDLSYYLFHVGGERRYSRKFVEIFGPPREKNDPVEKRHMDIACSGQRRLEEALLNMTDFLHEKSGETSLVITGGVGMNCVANGRILRESKFDNVFAGPSCHDAGVALGAALYVYYCVMKNRIVPIADKTAYWGEGFSDEVVEKALAEKKLEFKKFENVESECAKLLEKGKIIAWFQGRSEFGPRALGNRSILANPKIADIREIINLKVKRREEFRPFAPSILMERATEYFEDIHPSDYMTFVFNVKEGKKSEIPAVTHVDGSARVQTVEQENNPKYYKLIKIFGELTGTPVLLNTSFNIQEPIVNSPQEAVDCFLRSNLDYLVIHDFIAQNPESNR